MAYIKNKSLENIEGETWKDIPGYEGWYQVSDKGRVKSMPRPIIRSGDGATLNLKEKILAANLNSSKYPEVVLHKNKKGRIWRVHRLVMLAFIGPSDLHIDHLNMIRYDNRLENLEYVTHRENISRSRVREKLPTGVKYGNGDCFEARICLNYQKFHLGSFKTIKEASDQYQRALNDLGNIHLYIKTQKDGKYGKGVDYKGGKYHARTTEGGMRKFLGVFDTAQEAAEVARKYREEHGLR